MKLNKITNVEIFPEGRTSFMYHDDEFKTINILGWKIKKLKHKASWYDEFNDMTVNEDFIDVLIDASGDRYVKKVGTNGYGLYIKPHISFEQNGETNYIYFDTYEEAKISFEKLNESN